jgi:splicing factor 1
MATGANTTPLGRLHPILAAKKGQSPAASDRSLIPATAMGGILPTPHGTPTPVYTPPAPDPVTVGASKAASVVASLSSGAGSKDPELKKHLEAAKRAASALFPEEPARKKRKSRWASETVRTAIPGLPTTLPPNLTDHQQQMYILHLKVEEASRQLRAGDLGIPINPADRCRHTLYLPFTTHRR